MKETATAIVRRLQAAGHIAYFAGGCVRDMVRGTEPHDFDIATSAPPEEVQRLFARTVPVGAQFGVMLVLEGGWQFEVATFRSDEAYVDGRRPTGVRYGLPEADAQRRDLTINGLFFDPVNGAIIDFVGGRRDIAAQLVRTIGDPRQRFAEDKLRLLRVVRFAANLGYQIEAATLAVVQQMAGQIQVVSAERIRDELVRIFTRPNAGRGLALLAESGLLREVLPEVAAMQGIEQPPQFHPEGDVFSHVRLMLELLTTPDGSGSGPSPAAGAPGRDPVVLALAVLLHDVGKPPTFERAPDRIRFNEHDRVGAELAETILRRLRFPNDQIARIVTCVREHMRFQHVREMRPAKLKRILARATFPEELELHRIDCLASHRNLENHEFLKAKAAEIPATVLRPAPLVTGHDLLDLGFPPGPALGRVLRELADLQLDEQLHTREQALAYARKRLGETGSAGATG